MPSSDFMIQQWKDSHSAILAEPLKSSNFKYTPDCECQSGTCGLASHVARPQCNNCKNLSLILTPLEEVDAIKNTTQVSLLAGRHQNRQLQITTLSGQRLCFPIYQLQGNIKARPSFVQRDADLNTVVASYTTSNLIYHSAIMEMTLGEHSNHLTTYTCGSKTSTIVMLPSFENLEAIVKLPGFSEDSTTLNPTAVRYLWRQLCMILNSVAEFEVRHGLPCAEFLSFSILDQQLKMHLRASWASTAQFKTSQGVVQLAAAHPVSKPCGPAIQIHESVYLSPSEVENLPTYEVLTETQHTAALNRRRVLTYRLLEIHNFNAAQRSSVVAPTGSSFDTYAFMIALMSSAAMYNSVLADSRNLNIFRSFWVASEFDCVLRELQVLTTFPQVSYSQIYEFLSRFELRFDILAMCNELLA